MFSRYRKLSLVLSLLLLTGCSSTTFIYNRLDFIIPWYMDDYVELNRSQESLLDDLLQPALTWHRYEELPQYLTTLVAIEKSLDRDITAKDIAHFSKQLEDALTRIESAILELTLTLGDQLSDKQIVEFLEVLREQQEEYKEEYLSRSDKEYAKDNYESLLDSFQDYLGRLDKAQREVIQVASADFDRFDIVWLAERDLWLEQLDHILQREPGWQQQLREARARREEQTSPVYLASYERNVSLVQQSMVDVLNSRTKKQDKRLRRKLKDIREDLESLISDKG